jgi:hypothetical protein
MYYKFSKGEVEVFPTSTHAMKAQRMSGVTAPFIFNFDHRWS